MNTLLTQSDVATLAGVLLHRLRGDVKAGVLPPPAKLRDGTRAYYTPRQADAIRRYYADMTRVEKQYLAAREDVVTRLRDALDEN